MGKLLIILFSMGQMAWASGTCNSLFLSEPSFIYTKDLIPTGVKVWDESAGYAYKLDENVIIVQLDLGPGYPKPYIGVFLDDGTPPDLKKYYDFIDQHGMDKGISLLIENPTYLLTQ